ncbi:hypothetical protein BO70DRAFT_398140 [Aspergillus heteromorphus CBS 117.55]|uniref:HNH domain-containing protein n=1 Tax=Aspergillus heteromorphus CBS 117.55 TaxID=1448321 RepID=A0A317VTK1_9EURO|nr:uncharacterized protein BO70DRAFT_398140 [Aspergillus heteromorphus CBS 117.55]PWY76272.1 hypothetical protein BO70DRAFT_398140 [Aspergillus heteromorphus CBS 117.55]
MTPLDSENYQIFRECVSSAIVAKSTPSRPPKKARRSRPQRQKSKLKPQAQEQTQTEDNEFQSRADPEDLADFIDFIASETFPSLPPTLQTLTYDPTTPSPFSESEDQHAPQALATTTSHTLPPSIPDTLTTYALITDAADLPSFLSPILAEYIASVTKPPPVWATTRASACEICERDWIPLSYHHLIPRGVHAKVLKKGWHEEWMLNSVAWLCRACHSFVHRMASNEELAREWFTVDRICEREDVRVWAGWVGRVRWKAR